METLVAVLLRGIDIIDYRTRTLLETVGQHGIDMQALLLLLLQAVSLVDDTQVMLAVDMFEITTFGLHFAPDTIDMLRPAVDFSLHAFGFHF